MRWLHGQKVFCPCFLFFCVVYLEPEMSGNHMQFHAKFIRWSDPQSGLSASISMHATALELGLTLNNDEQWSPSNTCGAKSSINTIIPLCKWDCNGLYSGSCPKLHAIKTALGLTLLHEHFSLSLSLLVWCVSNLAEGRKKGTSCHVCSFEQMLHSRIMLFSTVPEQKPHSH